MWTYLNSKLLVLGCVPFFFINHFGLWDERHKKTLRKNNLGWNLGSFSSEGFHSPRMLNTFMNFASVSVHCLVRGLYDQHLFLQMKNK